MTAPTNGKPATEELPPAAIVMRMIVQRAQGLADKQVPPPVQKLLKGSKGKEMRAIIAAIAEPLAQLFVEKAQLEARIAKLEKAAESPIILPS